MTTRVGIVGTGYLGRLHARILTEMPEAEAVGLVEPRDSVAAEVGESFGLKRYGSVAELIPDIECAVVATTTSAHFEVARQLLEAGRDVLIEKPITSSVGEARALVELAESKQRIIQVGHVERYNPAIVAVAPFLSGVRYVEAERLGIFAGRSLDIDVLFDLMIHDLNLVLSLLHQEVADVLAVGIAVLTEKVDMANVRLQLANGAVANLTASRVSQERVRKVRFFGSDSYLSVDTKEQEVKGFRLVKPNGTPTIEPMAIPVEKKEPLRAELEAFLQSVRDRSRPIVSGEDGLAAVALATRVAEAIDHSLKGWRG